MTSYAKNGSTDTGTVHPQQPVADIHRIIESIAEARRILDTAAVSADEAYAATSHVAAWDVGRQLEHARYWLEEIELRAARVQRWIDQSIHDRKGIPL
ncbi:MAG TPA: hypothetical protein VKU87_04245 [Thermomicrobiaceae bacterium]|nr:hypothetical protein [Thermomicrobiaceae bacterium]